ncbi:MAG: helix-turn-helix domain-containing protein [Actinomycetota bacterium]|nr:helix-turn-helix domain-containing protein [Actinomycetota bacterium]
MPRPLTGSSWERGRRFYASVPAARGSRRRVEASFAAGSERDAWLAAAVAAADGGCRPPDPASFRNRRADSALLDNSPSPPSGAPTAASAGIGPRPLFEALAYGWLDEYYGQLRNADAERERDVRIMVENYLIPAFAGPVPADAAAARKRLVEFVRRMAREPEWETHACGESAGDGDRLLTIAEATVACDRSTATIRRALRAGELPGSRRGPDGRWLIPASVLDAAIRREALMRTAVSRPYARGILWAHAKILDWGRANGWEIAPFERGVNALTPHDEVARKRPDSGLRRPLTVAELARVASHLHVAHLGVAETTARRWMREQVVASTTDTDEFANPRRRSRLADVEAARDRLAGRVVLRDLAAELGVGYYRAWRALRRLDLVEASDDPPPRELVLTSEQAAALRVEFARLAALFDRSMRVSAAATQLGVAFGTAQRFVRRGELVLDPERDAFGAQYVTRASVEALTASRRGGKHAVGADQLVDARTVAQVTGLNQRQLSDLAVRGVLVRRDVGRRFHITADSVERWAARLGSEFLARLQAVQREGLSIPQIVELEERRTRRKGSGSRRGAEVASSDRLPQAGEGHRVG